MKKFTMSCCLVLVFGLTALAGATPITFDLAGSNGGSLVSIQESVAGADLTANLADNLNSQIFTLSDGQTQTVDFFMLTASGLGYGNYSISATLGFDMPAGIGSAGSGSGCFFTFYGLFSGGTLNWNPNTLPDYFTLADGNRFKVDFEDGVTCGIGNSTMVHAYITNLGGGSAPVPEPATLLLLGSGLIGLFSFGRRRMKL
jgi:hypothetical protein